MARKSWPSKKATCLDRGNRLIIQYLTTYIERFTSGVGNLQSANRIRPTIAVGDRIFWEIENRIKFGESKTVLNH